MKSHLFLNKLKIFVIPSDPLRASSVKEKYSTEYVKSTKMIAKPACNNMMRIVVELSLLSKFRVFRFVFISFIKKSSIKNIKIMQKIILVIIIEKLLIDFANDIATGFFG